MTGETKRGEEGPITVDSNLGWLLSHPINGTLDQCYVTYSDLIIKGQKSPFQPSQDSILVNKGFWETESIGVSNLTANGDVKCKSLEVDVKRNGDRYEVKLPWKDHQLSSMLSIIPVASKILAPQAPQRTVIVV